MKQNRQFEINGLNGVTDLMGRIRVYWLDIWRVLIPAIIITQKCRQNKYIFQLTVTICYHQIH